MFETVDGIAHFKVTIQLYGDFFTLFTGNGASSA
ncbi:MAG: hypothetical protein CG439_1393 [Methylococcaceae bacterium NSP1-2]|nr:MAG: hypothetical protein CG439_1393 [Methylococcaceae bacterium NSP1-2]